jgi:hypothetical protein
MISADNLVSTESLSALLEEYSFRTLSKSYVLSVRATVRDRLYESCISSLRLLPAMATRMRKCGFYVNIHTVSEEQMTYAMLCGAAAQHNSLNWYKPEDDRPEFDNFEAQQVNGSCSYPSLLLS